MNKEFNFELNNVNKKAIEELLKNKGVRKYAFKLENNEYLELVETQEYDKLKERIDKAIEYIEEYAWQEDIISDIYTTTGEQAVNRYMQLDWDNCDELLKILKGELE